MTVPSLAILGAPPRFVEARHVGSPNIGDAAEFQRVTSDILQRRWLTNNGQVVEELEHRLATLLGVRHCALCCNGTQALEILLRALSLAGEVIVPSFTFVATVHALRWMGLTPVFCDVDPDTHSLDPQCVEALITGSTSAILGVHVWGEPCAIEELSGIAARHGLALLFDAAHAFANTHQGTYIGNFGTAEVLSFHATKVFNTIEGGAVATNDDDLADRIRAMRNFGFAGEDRVTMLGTNGKLHEISAAMGLTNLSNLQTFIDHNRANHLIYRTRLDDLPGVRVRVPDPREARNHHYVVMEIDEVEAGISRDRVIEVLRAENVLARRYFWPGCHRAEPYRSDPRYAELRLPATEHIASRVVALPTGTATSTADAAQIAEVIRLAVEHAPHVR